MSKKGHTEHEWDLLTNAEYNFIVDFVLEMRESVSV